MHLIHFRQRGIRRREFERLIDELEKLPEAVPEFVESLWDSRVEYVMVGKDKTMVFTLLGGIGADRRNELGEYGSIGID